MSIDEYKALLREHCITCTVNYLNGCEGCSIDHRLETESIDDHIIDEQQTAIQKAAEEFGLELD